MSKFPILVEDYSGLMALAIVCERCNAESIVEADDLLNDGLYACPDGCGGCAVHKYERADRCPNCRKLGFYEQTLDYCCSRVCQLQNEYRKAAA